MIIKCVVDVSAPLDTGEMTRRKPPLRHYESEVLMTLKLQHFCSHNCWNEEMISGVAIVPMMAFDGDIVEQ